VSLDSIAGTHHYGDWIFFRYLSERYPTRLGALPRIIRDIWVKLGAAASTNGNPDMYSMEAVRSALGNRQTTFARVFARFGAINRHPAGRYEEGAAYKASPLSGTFGLSGSRRSTNWLYIKLNHQTHAHARIKPASTLTAADWRLRINLDLPSLHRGSAATVQVYRKNGSIGVYPVALSAQGTKNVVFPFSARKVKYVELTVTNASTSYACWQGKNWSCQGVPRDQNLKFEFRATAFRS
jgi:hypothetical protein